MAEIFVTNPLTATQSGTQIGYGHNDVLAQPFDFYSGIAVNGVTGSLVTGATINMASAKLVLAPAGAISVTINLPLNPPDGAEAEIANYVGAAGTVTTTVNANTGDILLGTAGGSLTAGSTFRYRYSLYGDVTKGSGPRTWVRIS